MRHALPQQKEHKSQECTLISCSPKHWLQPLQHTPHRLRLNTTRPMNAPAGHFGVVAQPQQQYPGQQMALQQPGTAAVVQPGGMYGTAAGLGQPQALQQTQQGLQLQQQHMHLPPLQPQQQAGAQQQMQPQQQQVRLFSVQVLRNSWTACCSLPPAPVQANRPLPCRVCLHPMSIAPSRSAAALHAPMPGPL